MIRPVVGIGEVLWDVFPDGRKVAGGAPFNFAFHSQQLGHAGTIVSRVGDDDLGRELREEVRRLGLSDEFIQTDRKRPTGTVKVIVNATGQPAYHVSENVAWDAIEWTPAVAELVRTAAAVCHGSLALRTKANAKVILKAAFRKSQDDHGRGLSVYDVNLRGGNIPETAVRHARWIKVNEEEYGQLEGCIDSEMDDDPWPRTTAGMFDFLRHCSGIEDRVILVTRGAAGAEVFTPADSFRVPATPATVADTVGAGDAFTAAMVCLHLEGRSLRDCARFATHYAARVCEHQGGTPRIDRAEVERAAFGTP
jgi:fructokinase